MQVYPTEGSVATLKSSTNGNDLKIAVTPGVGANTDVMFVDTSASRVGFFNSIIQQYNVDVNGTSQQQQFMVMVQTQLILKFRSVITGGSATTQPF